MSRDQFDRVVRIFEGACSLSVEERAAFLDAECRDDVALRAEVESLLEEDRALRGSSLFDGVDRELMEEAVAAFDRGGAPMPERIGPFRILGRLGSGGMGVVYRAEQESPRRTVALKVIHPGVLGPQALRRFEFEAQVLGHLQHPGIAQIYQAGTAKDPGDGRPIPFFAMELVEGSPITDFARDAQLGYRARLDLAARVCDAVHHAHQKGVIHRDLKPGNILVGPGEGRAPGSPKVLDFGIARATDADIGGPTMRTDIGQLLGTLPYMSPEQVGGDSSVLDIRSDVYSLGVILYELLSGDLPIDLGDASVPEAARRIIEVEPHSLGRRDTRFRGDIDTIVAKSLEKDPERRYASAAELAADLRRCLRNEPISARPASRLYQIGKFARRNRPIVAGVAAVIIALSIGFVAERHQRREAEDARGKEELARREAEDSQKEEAAARRAAEDALEGAQLVTGFLTDLLVTANPASGTGRDVTVREVILSVDEVLPQFAEQPEIEGNVHNAVAETLYGLGEVQKARRHLERAITLRLEHFGALHPSTLRSQNVLASCLSQLGEDRAALDLAEDVYSRSCAVLGVDHIDSITIHGVIAVNRDRLGLPDGEETLRRHAAICEEYLGAEHEKTLQALSNLAVRLRTQAKYEEAERIFQGVLDKRRELLGDDHPSTIISINNLAFLFNGQQRFADALPLFEEAHVLAVEVLGPDHHTTQMIENNLGVAYYAVKRYPEARPFFEAAIVKSTAEFGGEHPSTLLARGNLAGLYRKTGDLDEALARFPDVIAGYRQALRAGHPAIAIFVRLHGLTFLDAERYEEAEPLLIEAAECLGRAFGPTHTRVIDARKSVQELYEKWGKPEEAARWSDQDPDE